MNLEIDGFDVEITPIDDGVAVDISIGRHACSLALAEDYGTIGGDGPKISQDTLNKITKLALKHGY